MQSTSSIRSFTLLVIYQYAPLVLVADKFNTTFNEFFYFFLEVDAADNGIEARCV